MLEQVKEHLKASEISQRELSKLTGVPERFISNLKTGLLEKGKSRYRKTETIDDYMTKLSAAFNNQDYHPQPIHFFLYDLEISPALGWAYGTYNTNLLKVEKEQMLMSFSYLTVEVNGCRSLLDGDTDSIKCVTLYDVNFNEEALVKKLWDLINENDIICGYNNDKFDNKVINTFFIKYNLPSPPPFKSLDMMKEWKSNARLTSNGLDHVCDVLFGERKTELRISDLWYKCIVERDREAWQNLAKYNIQDSYLTYRLLQKMSSYIKSNINLALLMHIPQACPKCGFINEFEKSGYYYASTIAYEQYRCSKCGGYIHKVKQLDNFKDFKPLYKK